MNLLQNSQYSWNIFFFRRSIRVLLELVHRTTQNFTKIDEEKHKIDKFSFGRSGGRGGSYFPYISLKWNSKNVLTTFKARVLPADLCTDHAHYFKNHRLTHSRAQCLRIWECARKLWETLRRSSQNLAIWASERMLFDPTKTFCFFYVYFIAIVLYCLAIRTEEIQLTALKNFQVSKTLVVVAEKIPLNVPNHRFETWSLHMFDGWLNISVD